MNDQNDIIDLDNDDLAQTPEEKAIGEADYLEELKARVLLRTHSFLYAPDEEDLYWLLTSLARYMSANGVKVTSEKTVLLTWHRATCGECDVDSDGSMNSGCDIYDEYVHGLQWNEPKLPRRGGGGMSNQKGQFHPTGDYRLCNGSTRTRMAAVRGQVSFGGTL